MFQSPSFLAALLVLSMFLSACAREPPVDAPWAQCHIESFGDVGRRFISEFPNVNPQSDPDRAYRNWMLMCMRAKGFSYDNTKCAVDQTGIFTQIAASHCYKPTPPALD
jgi:invasion protein IalB